MTVTVLMLMMSVTFTPSNVQAATKLEKKANKIIKAAKVKKSDEDIEKLEKLFKYVTYKKGKKENFKYIGNRTYTKDSKKKTWPNTYAYNMFMKKGGSCFEYAAGYGFLALKATGLKVRVGVGMIGKTQRHAWTEIKINKKWYIFDTNRDKYMRNGKKKLTYFNKLRKKVKKDYNKYKGVKYYTLKF